MAFGNLAYASERREDRHEVHHRTIARRDAAGDVPVLIVNISPNGLMARCDAGLDPGVQLSFRLPDHAPILGEVRWSLGGRIGCEFDRSIPEPAYYALLAKLTR